MLRKPLLTVLTLVTMLLATGGFLLGSAPSASAHARLVSTTPSNNGVLTEPPAEVTLTFSENVVATGTQLQVKGPNGTVHQGPPSATGPTVSQPITVTQVGAYTVTWRVTSTDGHPISGTFAFVYQGSARPSSTGAVIGPATTSGPALSSGRAPTSTTSGRRVNRVDSDATANHPGLILGGAAVALLLMGGGAVLARRRLTDDDH